MRSGRASTFVAADLKRTWQTELGGKLSSVVIADEKLFVAQVDAHTLHALDSSSGRTLWSYTAGGRVDSPPTIHQGRVLFGSADGWVYCLRASDGELIWRFRAAPEDRRLISFEQVESVWPVHGNVLLQDDIVYFVAGRSMFLDGGMRLLRLDPKTGRKISEKILDNRDPVSGEDLQKKVTGLNMPAALPDVLSSDGRFVYMRTQRFDLEGNRRSVAPMNVTEQEGEGTHLFCGAGFLDGSWFHRAYYVYGKSIASGANGWFLAGRNIPAGRLLVHDDDSVYGFGRKPGYFRWSTPLEYQLFASEKRPKIIGVATGDAKNIRRQGRQEKCQFPNTKLEYLWSKQTPVLARAMVLADRILFVAGPPDVLDEESVFGRPVDAAIREKLNQQDASFGGQKGALLWAVSASDGKRLAEYNLDFPPVWDGMAAAGGRLYLSTIDGKVSCFASD